MACANICANIVIVGVGGQGTLLASRIIGSAAIKMGYDVKVSEVHGMSQRGGSVVTFVRYGNMPISSPIIDAGKADVVLGFEKLEAYRGISYLKKDGILIANTQEIDPMPVITGANSFPCDIISKIKEKGIKVEALDAMELAIKAGNEKSVNVVLIGKMASALDIPMEIWISVLQETVKKEYIDSNMNAFKLGYQY